MTPEHLRFDFTHFEALSSEQLKAVEDLVNQQIFASKPVVTRVMGIDEAKAAGAVALFGEKYGDVVRVVSVCIRRAVLLVEPSEIISRSELIQLMEQRG